MAGSESDIWAQDTDPILGPIETSLYEHGSRYLQGTHRSLHRALGLPSVRLDDLTSTYPAIRIAKAEERDRDSLMQRAYTSLRAILARRGEADHQRGVPPEEYDDLIDATTDHWLAHGHLKTTAQKHAVAAHIAGRLRTSDTPPRASANALLNDYVREVGDRERERIEYARASAAMYVTRLDHNTRHAMRAVIYEWEQSRESKTRLEQTLRETFGALNRDWRRIALTEASFARANGVLASLKLGTRVEWRAAGDACPHCRRLHGRSFLLVSADRADKDPHEHVWIGKAQARKRPIGEHPAIPLHPHCRCAWMVLHMTTGPVPEHILRLGQELVMLASQP